VKLGRGGTWPSTHADAVAVAELAANPRFAPTCPLSPQSLSWRYRIQSRVQDCVVAFRSRAVAFPWLAIIWRGVELTAGREYATLVTPRGMPSTREHRTSTTRSRRMSFRLHGTIIFSKACCVLRVQCYHPARTAEGVHFHPISDFDICRARRLLRCHVIPSIPRQ